MFESLQPAPADAILKLIAESKADNRPEKIDLGIGVYFTEDGRTPVLNTVKKAEHRILGTQETKAYLGTAGSPEFNAAMQKHTFATDAYDDRLITVQAPGGSGSLRLAAGLMYRTRPDAKLWVSEPTWANHVPLLGSVGFELVAYPYYDTDNHTIQFDDMIAGLKKADAGDIVVLHACCHN
ncbi:MAG: aminotransferase class I/II-fold pyridoxal phosphate-dependent enzyme, partial [Pseudomonadota bacterium]